ncbi:hypothetical protein ABIE44_000310 [Marmoricola sp. OAE513]|uniref:DUF3352 domain-containing protein n=1 Tax=Marmoricola sp. OAE513 TaxID=2817894 RepID=UPI001AE7FCC5
MSDDQTPVEPTGSTEPTVPVEPVQPTEPTVPVEGTEPTATLPPGAGAAHQDEAVAVAPEPAAGGKKGRRGLVVGIVALVVAALLGGGAWAVVSFFFGGGPQPEEALPTSTVAVISLDLDPSGGQKIAAIKAIRKFPALKDELGINTRDDLRKFVFEKATEDEDCGLDYDDDIKPWIGQRVAFAAVDLGDKNPVPALALKIEDQKKAKANFQKLVSCADLGDDVGFAVGKDYLIASDSIAHAKKILEDGQEKPLADDKTYKKWADEVGDKGVVNFYVSPKVIDYASDLLDEFGSELFGGTTSGELSSDSLEGGFGESAARSGGSTADPDCDTDAVGSIKDGLKNFGGLAGTVRFADGGMELSVVSGGKKGGGVPSSSVGKQIQALPKDSALAFGFGVPKGYADDFVTGFKAGTCGEEGDLLGEFEDETGLKIPEDLDTLLGKALTLSLGGDAPADLAQIEGFSEIPVGLVVHGDGQKIKDLIARLEDTFGASLADVQIGVKSSGDRVVLSTSEDYADSLLENGSLGDSSRFKDAIPEAGRASSVFYVDFNSEWRDAIISAIEDSGADASEVRDVDENTKPLKSLGISSWNDGGVAHILVKLATD